MLRPIESNLSLYNVVNKASQFKDPSAHQFQAMQQNEINAKAQMEAHTVQPTVKPEGDVKVRERKDEREQDGRRKNRGQRESVGSGEQEEQSVPADNSGRLNFLA